MYGRQVTTNGDAAQHLVTDTEERSTAILYYSYLIKKGKNNNPATSRVWWTLYLIEKQEMDTRQHHEAAG